MFGWMGIVPVDDEKLECQIVILCLRKHVRVKFVAWREKMGRKTGCSSMPSW